MRDRLAAVGVVLTLVLGVVVAVQHHSTPHRAAVVTLPHQSSAVPPSPSSIVAAPSLATPPASSPAASPAAVPKLTWKGCEGDDFQCATLPVPLDPDHPEDGRTIPLALLRLPARDPAHRIGTLVVNPGGPGASGYDWLLQAAPDVFSTAILQHFDLVGFDPRGVGRSDGVRCADGHTLDVLFHTDPVPRTSAARQTSAARAAAFVQDCEAKDGPLLAHVGTVEAAGDIDRIRQALREKTISYFGYSYGTYLGATWADLYPTTVRAAVLDGPLDPALDLAQFVDGQGKAFDHELRRFFAWCDSTADCAFRVAGGSSAQKYDALAARIHASPIRGVTGRTLGNGELQYAVGYGMYSRSFWPDLGTALELADAGNGSGLLSMSDSYLSRMPGGGYDDSFDANLAVNCLDHAGPRTEDGWYDQAAATARSAPRLGFAIVYTTLPCATWPVPGRPARIPTAAGAPPLVVVGGVNDPATPYAWAQALHKDLVGSRLITREHDGHGDGHTSYGPASPCTTRLVDAYLLDGTLPAEGATC